MPDVQFPTLELHERILRHCSRRDHILAAAHYLESLFRQVFGIASDAREEFSFGDRIRNIPVWPEYDVLHSVAEYRGIVAICFAHHDTHREHDLVIFIVCAEAKFGDVGHDGR